MTGLVGAAQKRSPGPGWGWGWRGEWAELAQGHRISALGETGPPGSEPTVHTVHGALKNVLKGWISGCVLITQMIITVILTVIKRPGGNFWT